MGDRTPPATTEASDGGVSVTYNGTTEQFDYLCIAAGRAPDLEELGLDEAKVKTGERGMIEVDGNLRTSRDGVYAIGDMVPGPALAHKASDEGIIAVETAAGLEPHPIDYAFVPAVTFCHPQVASFGLTEQEARDAGYDVVVGKVPMGAVGAPVVYGDRGGSGRPRGSRPPAGGRSPAPGGVADSQSVARAASITASANAGCGLPAARRLTSGCRFSGPAGEDLKPKRS